MNDKLDWIDRELAVVADSGLLRKLSVCAQGEKSTELKIAEKTYINFSSNDYLGLAAELVRAQEASPSEGQKWGSGASPLVTGRGEMHQQLEQALAKFKGTEAALSFSSTEIFTQHRPSHKVVNFPSEISDWIFIVNLDLGNERNYVDPLAFPPLVHEVRKFEASSSSASGPSSCQMRKAHPECEAHRESRSEAHPECAKRIPNARSTSRMRGTHSEVRKSIQYSIEASRIF